jgi:hypothetical protein
MTNKKGLLLSKPRYIADKCKSRLTPVERAMMVQMYKTFHAAKIRENMYRLNGMYFFRFRRVGKPEKKCCRESPWRVVLSP